MENTRIAKSVSPISTSVQGLVNVHIVVFQTSIRPTTWDQHVQELFCHNSRVISLTARSAVLSLSGSRLLCGPGVALGDAGSAAGKGPRAGQGCQLRKVAESKKWVDSTIFSQEILFVFLDMERLDMITVHYLTLYIFVFGVISGGNQHGHITNENGFVMIYQIL